MRLKSVLMTLAKLVFAASLLAWLILTKKFNFDDLRPYLTWQGIFVSLSLVGLNITLLGERWRYLIKSQLGSASVGSMWRLNLIGIFFNFAMPGGIGGDVIKAYYLQKEMASSRSVAYSSALMDRALGLYTFILMSVMALLIEYTSLSQTPLVKTLLIWGGFIFIGMTAGLIILKAWNWPDSYHNHHGLKGRLFRFMKSFKLYTHDFKLITVSIFITLIAQGLCIAFFGWSLNSILGQHIEWSTLFFIVPVGFMVMSIPLTPAGVGVGQTAFYYLFHSFTNVDQFAGPAVITAFQVMQLAWGLLGAYFYLTRSNSLELQRTQKSH